ncbi:MAG: ethanolamine ammonia-lyase reactivating factor EutA [Paenibacillaceae bacterium]
MEEQWITSVGIDLGTSTTKFIVSRLRLARMSNTLSLPRYEIVERKIDYMSPIIQTPLTADDLIDTDLVSEFLLSEFWKAKVDLHDVKTGAVIITGETATKRNAERIVHYLAEKSGDFVVATAGADLEALLAGKGSGAFERSERIRGIICNVDVGGGTANCAYFQNGRTIAMVTFHVGGRLIRLDAAGNVNYVSKQLKAWLNRKGLDVRQGGRISFPVLKHLVLRLSESMLSYISGKSQEDGSLLIVGEAPRQRLPVPNEVMFSGGVAHLQDRPIPNNLADTVVYGDIGPLLAHSLVEESAHCPFVVRRATQTVRATVIGAGMQSMEISGATIHIEKSILPLRNLPVLTLELSDEANFNRDGVRAAVDHMLTGGFRLYGADQPIPFAIALKGIEYCSYSLLQTLSDELAGCYKQQFPLAKVLVVVCESDMAKALGQSLQLRCDNRPSIVCIDQIRVEHGDYIDLGEPLPGDMIPVSVKTLAFSNNNGSA